MMGFFVALQHPLGTRVRFMLCAAVWPHDGDSPRPHISHLSHPAVTVGDWAPGDNREGERLLGSFG